MLKHRKLSQKSGLCCPWSQDKTLSLCSLRPHTNLERLKTGAVIRRLCTTSMAGISLTGPDIRQHIGNVLFTLLILVIMLDPTNTVLHLKDVFFVLLVGYNMVCFRPDWHYLPHIAAVFGTVTMGYLVAEVQQNAVDMEKLLAIYKSVSPLVLLLWIKYYDVLRLSLIPAVLTSLLVIVLYVVASVSEVFEYELYTFFSAHNDMVMMTRRSFLGFPVFGMYYKSLVSLSFAMFFVFYKTVHSGGRALRLFCLLLSVFFFVAFLMSGTRGTMLLPFFMVAVVFCFSLKRMGKFRYLVYPLLVFYALFVLGVVLLLASEADEVSNSIKYAHIASYVKLFSEHPWYLLTGQGAATSFYTEGMRRMVTETEWSYIELLRCYGLFSLLVMGVLLYPLKNLWAQARGDDFMAGVLATYVVYLLVAGTNPLLLSSTGMIMIWVVYSQRVNRPTVSKSLGSGDAPSGQSVPTCGSI